MRTQALSSPAETAPRAKVHVASVVAAAALVVSGLALVVAELVLPGNAIPEGAAGLAAIQANMQAYMLAKWIGFVFTLCMPLGLIGVVALAYQRRAWAACIGASLTILGGLFHAAAYTFEGVIVPAMARMADRQPEMAALLDRINSNPAAYPLFALMILFNLGLLIMAIVGGAIIPVIQCIFADHFGIHHAFFLPAICYLYIVYYALKGSRPALTT